MGILCNRAGHTPSKRRTPLFRNPRLQTDKGFGTAGSPQTGILVEELHAPTVALALPRFGVSPNWAEEQVRCTRDAISSISPRPDS